MFDSSRVVCFPRYHAYCSIGSMYALNMKVCHVGNVKCVEHTLCWAYFLNIFYNFWCATVPWHDMSESTRQRVTSPAFHIFFPAPSNLSQSATVRMHVSSRSSFRMHDSSANKQKVALRIQEGPQGGRKQEEMFLEEKRVQLNKENQIEKLFILYTPQWITPQSSSSNVNYSSILPCQSYPTRTSKGSNFQ